MKSWAGNPFKFQWQNSIKYDFFFRPGFSSVSPDKVRHVYGVFYRSCDLR